MLQTVAPRPWARRMLSWHLYETVGYVEFMSGSVIERLRGFQIIEWAEKLGQGSFDKGLLTKARSRPMDDIELDHEWNEFPICLPVDTLAFLDAVDWERGTAKGELHDLGKRYEYLVEEWVPAHKDIWYSIDLADMNFPLSMIEMLAPNAPAPVDDLFARKANTAVAAKGGPGRRRKHDWDGALLYLLGEAERNAIAPDPSAHGTQADIASMMADWFAKQGADIPANSQLQSMAGRVLRQIEATRPRA
jgi:hypothetical protein